MLNNRFLAASFLALKYSFEKEWIEGNAAELLMLAARGPKNLQKGYALHYAKRNSAVKPKCCFLNSGYCFGEVFCEIRTTAGAFPNSLLYCSILIRSFVFSFSFTNVFGIRSTDFFPLHLAA